MIKNLSSHTGRHLTEKMISQIQARFNKQLKAFMVTLLALTILVLVEPFVISAVLLDEGMESNFNSSYFILFSQSFFAVFILVIMLFMARRMRFTWVTEEGDVIHLYSIRNATDRELFKIYNLCQSSVSGRDYIREVVTSGRHLTNVDLVYVERRSKVKD